MNQFKKPLVIAGQGIRQANAVDELQKFCEWFKIPLVYSRLGVDLLLYKHPLHLGQLGIYGSMVAKLALNNADVLFILGCRLSTATVGYEPKLFAPKAVKIMVDVDDKELNKNEVQLDFRIHQDVKKFLQESLHGTVEVSSPEWVKQCQDWKKKYPVLTPAMKKIKPVSSYYFIDRLAHFAKPSDIILVDTGSCFHVAAQGWKLKQRQRYITTGGLSSMGWWAASLGAATLGRTICITGDGSLQMNIQELATIKHNKLPIKLFVLNNEGYGLIRNTFKRFKLGQIGESEETGLWCPPLYWITKAYKLQFMRCNDVRYLDTIIKETLRGDEPIVCEIATPKWEELLRT